MTATKRHAEVQVSGFKVPLIGLPAMATEETCDLCGDIFPLWRLEWTGKQWLCKKCKNETQPR